MERGISQEQLGLQIDSGRTYVSELERGRHSPTLNWLFRLAEALDFSPSELIRRVETLRTERSGSSSSVKKRNQGRPRKT
jgi:transcriptional regulator with XRE-family HTH domain